MGSNLIKNHKLIHGSTVGHAKVITKDVMTSGKVVPGYSMTPTYITIHNVGDDDVPATTWDKALHNANKYGTAGGYRIASWHVTVDYNKIYQEIPFNKVAWHAGDGEYGKGNRHSIGIENCQYSHDKTKQRLVWENCAALCVELMKEYPVIDLAHIVQHYFWTRKDCPYLLRHKRFGYDWTWYKNLIKSTKSSTTAPNDKPATNEFKPYIVKIIVDELNVRTGPGVDNDKVGELKKDDAYTIVEESNGWGKLKSGAGWINVSSKYVKKL